MTLKLIKGPNYRLDALSSLKLLANRELQMKEWLTDDLAYPHKYWDCLQYNIFDTLFDFCELHDPKWVAENGLFYDEEEEKIVIEFINFIDEKSYNVEEPDEFYLKDPEWPKVWEGAAKVVSLMEANNKKYDFSECHSLWASTIYKKWNSYFEKK